MATLTVYPIPGTTVDGYVDRLLGGENWATIRAGAGTAKNDTVTEAVFIEMYADTSSGNWLLLMRSIFLFDTSALTSGATISAAVMSLYGTNKADPSSNTPTLNIYTSTPASNTALANADYGQVGSTAQCDTAVTYAGWSTTGYNNFTFNATGRGNISKTGISKFGVRNNYDAVGTTPTWGDSADTYFGCVFSNDTSGTKDPKLVITYTTLVAPQINIGDVWKNTTTWQINIGDVWKTVTKVQINVGDVWKDVF